MSVYGKLACGLVALLASPLAPGADEERGRALYELRCGTCHSESVHGRQKRVAADFHEVRAWVGRWSAHLGLRWTSEEIDDVAVHVNNAYYRYKCPPHVCTVVSRLSR
jgi:mono/diheme cytochrome c family protein